MKRLDKEILSLAGPSILANITVPLVGMVDIAVVGHLGAAAVRNADFVWFTTDDPDAEAPDVIFRDLIAGTDGAGNYRCIADRRQALLTALSELRPGDALLVTGKRGDYQLIAGERVPFSDRDIIRGAPRSILF